MRLILLVLFLPITTYCQINKNGDFQIWHYTQLSTKLTENQSIQVEGEVRFGDDASRLFFTYAQMQWVYEKGILEIAPGYRQLLIRTSTTDWETVYSPIIDISFKYDVRKWKLIDRNRIQYLIDNNSRRWFYRNRLRLVIPIHSFSFVTDDELFFLEGEGFNQNRFSVGFHYEFTDHAKVRIFYMLRHAHVLRWDHQKILGLYLHLAF